MALNNARRPSVFVGSSREGLPIAKAIQSLLDYACEVKIWYQAQNPPDGIIQWMDDMPASFDFAILVLTADDIIVSRGTSEPAPRDNLLFELGLFYGTLGRTRTFIVHDRSVATRFPTDLQGLFKFSYTPHVDGNWRAALGSACNGIEEAILRLGRRDDVRSSQDLGLFELAARAEDRSPYFRNGIDYVIKETPDRGTIVLVGRTLLEWSNHDYQIADAVIRRGVKCHFGIADPTNPDLVSSIIRDTATDHLELAYKNFKRVAKQIDAASNALGCFALYGLPGYLAETFQAHTRRDGTRLCAWEIGMGINPGRRPLIGFNQSYSGDIYSVVFNMCAEMFERPPLLLAGRFEPIAQQGS
jgi:hypothetical protein